MADLDLISEAKIEVTTSGIDAANAGVKSLGAGVDGLVVAQDKLTAAQIRVNAQLEATAKKYDAEYRALSELSKAVNLLERARSQGLTSTEAYGRIQDNVTLKLQAQANAARVANEAQQKLAATIREQAQASINTRIGVQDDFDTASRAADIAAYGAELDRLREKFVPLFALSQQLARSQAEVAEALNVGAISANEAAAANLRLTRAYEDQTQKLEGLAQRQKESAQRSVNSQLIVPDRGADIAAYAQELDALQAKFDPAFRAEQAYLATVEELDRALKVGAITQDVYNARVAEQGAILDGAMAKINGLADAQEKAASAVKTAAAAQQQFNELLNVRTDFDTASRAADIEAYGRAIDATRAKYVPLARAEQDYEAGLREVKTALAAGVLTTNEAAAANLRLTRTYQDQIQGLESVAAAQKASAQRQVNQQTITPDRAADIEAYGKALDDLQAKYDPLFAAEKELVATEAEINKAAAAGALTEQQRVKALDQAASRFNNQRIEIQKSEEANTRLSKSVGLNAYAYQNLSYQVNDVVTSLASGISPFQTLAQQGGQIFQILQTGNGGVSGALKDIASRLAAINPLVGVFGALAVGLGLAAVAANSFAKAQRDVQLALLGAGQGAGVSADQIQSIAEKASRASTITVAAARDIEKAFLDGGKVYGEVFGKGITAVDDFAKASKQDVGDAAKFIAGALGNLGGGGFEDLAKKAGNFDAAFEKTVKDAINRGDDLKAQELVIQRFGEAFDKASEKATGLQSVLQRADQVFKNVAESFGKTVVQAFNGAPLQKQIEDLNASRRNIQTIAQASGQPADTSAIDAKIAAKTKALNEQTVAVQKNAEATRANADAQNRQGTTTLVPAVAGYESLVKSAAAANKELNALEAQQANGISVPTDRINAARGAVANAAAGLKDYALSQNGATMEADKARKVLAAGLQTIQAVTPEQKAAAASAKVQADAYGTATSAAQRNREAADAYNKTLAESRQQTINTNRAQDEGTKTANKVADATTKTGQSLEYLKAQRQAEAEAANGTISQSEVEERRKTILRASIAALNQQKAEEIRASRDTTSVQQGLNDKVAAGTMVSAEAQRRAAALNEQMKLAREVDAASGEEKAALATRLKELTAATEAQLDAEKRTQVLSMTEETNRQIETLQKEGELLGSNNRDRAIALAQLQAEQNLKRQGISVTAPESQEYINKEKLKADLGYAKDQYTRLSQDITSALGGIFDDMTQSGKKNLTTFFDSFSKGFSKIGTRMLEQNLISPLINGGLDGKGGDSGPSFIDKIGALFSSGGQAEKAIGAGAEKGIFGSFSDLLGGTKNGAANGGFAKSPLGGALASAAVGGSIGYTSQSPITGALGGALTGFATQGPIGAVIGGAAGILGGLFGESQAKKQAKKQLQQELQARRDAYEQAKPQIEALDRTFLGESIGAVGAKILDAQTQLKQAAKTASDAGDTAKANKLIADFVSYTARMRAVFSDSFEGVLGDVSKGFGPDGPFGSAFEKMQQLGESLKAFVTDAAALPDPQNGQRARAAAVENALGSLDAPKTLSETQQEIERIQGTAAGLNQVLKDLGLSADQAAAAISARTNVALATLADKFNTDLDKKINTAKGKDYLNDASDLIKEVAGLQQDAAALGQDGGKIGDYFGAAAQKIVDGSQLAGAAFQELIAQFPQLNGLVHEYSAALTDSAAAMQAAIDRAGGFQDRLFAATHRSDSLVDQLATYDRQADKDRAAEVKAGGQALVDLEAAQAAERANIIADYGARTADRLKGYSDRLFAATTDTSTMGGALAAFDRQAQQERADEVKAGGEGMVELEAALQAERLQVIRNFQKQAQTAFDAFADTIKKFLDNLVAGSNSPLSPQDRLAAAQSQYDQQLAAARGGNQTALGSITTYAQSLLDASKAFYASSQAFQDTFKSVTSSLGALPGQVGVGAFMQYATGGWVQGPGTGTSDSILARVSNGEFVMSASAADRYGPLLEAMNDDRPMTVAAPPRAPASSGSQSGAAMVAELRSLRAEVAALRGDVQDGNEIADAGHMGTIAATRDVGAGIAKGNRAGSRREVAA